MAFLSFRRDGDTQYALRKAVLPAAFHISVIRAPIAESVSSRHLRRTGQPMTLNTKRADMIGAPSRIDRFSSVSKLWLPQGGSMAVSVEQRQPSGNKGRSGFKIQAGSRRRIADQQFRAKFLLDVSFVGRPQRSSAGILMSEQFSLENSQSGPTLRSSDHFRGVRAVRRLDTSITRGHLPIGRSWQLPRLARMAMRAEAMTQ
jgi:hypothetical protein